MTAAKTLNVLLVEDDEGIAALESATLERHGFRVKLAAIGQRALECLEEYERLALVVLDYKLPDMTGADIVAALGDRLATLPVVMVTGYPDPVVEERMRAAGVFDYIIKDTD
ncbi:MAG: response regulator, partial [bacterium]|nr:response regulator [bacterium]